jgi:putative ABC transport system ATP-binding protein
MLDRFGIVAKKDLFPSQLPGGQQQWVAIARALGQTLNSFWPTNPLAISSLKAGQRDHETLQATEF